MHTAPRSRSKALCEWDWEWEDISVAQHAFQGHYVHQIAKRFAVVKGMQPLPQTWSGVLDTGPYRFIPHVLCFMNELLCREQATHAALAAGCGTVAQVQAARAAPVCHHVHLIQILAHAYRQAGAAPISSSSSVLFAARSMICL